MEDKKPTVDRTENNNAETETPKLDLKDRAAETAEAESPETAETAEKEKGTEKAEQTEKTAAAGKNRGFRARIGLPTRARRNCKSSRLSARC